MNMTSNRIGLAALALALAFSPGCAKKKPKQLPPVPIDSGTATTDEDSGADAGNVGQTALPGSRADFLQNVPADRVYFATDEYAIDAEDRAVLDSQATW